MKRAVRSVLMMSALMSPAAVLALGLGEIRLNSALNEPFDAEIELVAATPEDLAALRASLASNDIFDRYGLDRPAYLTEFNFRVARSNGKDVLKVTSRDAVTEPFVTLLVEANWPRGNLLREYTVLLDPPLYAPAMTGPESAVVAPAEATPPPAATVGRGQVEPFAAAPPPPRTTPSPAPAAGSPTSRSAPTPSLQPGSSYKVRRNDTLSRIASQVSPGSRADVNRAMLAIYQANPQAFGGNINLLHAGSVLSIPEAGELSAIPATAAANEVARQYRMWRDGTTEVASEADDGGQLRLVTPEQGTSETSSTVSPAVEPGEAGTDDLAARVQTLEQELAEARRLLEVRNAELATLQGVAPGEPASDSSAVGESSDLADEQAVTEAVLEPVAEAPLAEAPVAPPAETVAPVAAEPAAPPPVEDVVAADDKPGLLSRLADYWWLLLALLAALAGYVFFKRSREERGEVEDSLEQAMTRHAAENIDARAATASAIVVEEKEVPDHTASATGQVPEPSRRPVSIEDTLSGAAPVGVDAGDPLAEADFHMAYGLYDQAADLVQAALKREPERRDLKLKLLEIFFVWGNSDRFLEIAREMHADPTAAEAGEWDKIVIMGKQIAPDDELFTGVAVAQSPGPGLDMELHGSASDLDMDFSVGAVEQAGEESAQEAKVSDDGGLDFVIDEPVRGNDEATVKVAGTPEAPDSTTESTAEVPIESLALEAAAGDDVADTFEGLSGLDDGTVTLEAEDKEDTVENPLIDASDEVSETAEQPLIATAIDDTVERPTVAEGEVDETVERPLAGHATSDTAEHPVIEDLPPAEDADMLSVTSILKADAITDAIDSAEDAATLEETGEMPSLEEADRIRDEAEVAESLEAGLQAVDFSLSDEASTMSEVGTKLDLARAYIDMGDPDGARSILEEVMSEGNGGQKQEAERLIANLP